MSIPLEPLVEYSPLSIGNTPCTATNTIAKSEGVYIHSIAFERDSDNTQPE